MGVRLCAGMGFLVGLVVSAAKGSSDVMGRFIVDVRPGKGF